MQTPDLPSDWHVGGQPEMGLLANRPNPMVAGLHLNARRVSFQNKTLLPLDAAATILLP